MRSGLKKVTKSVRGRRGMVRRSYWIKAKEGAKSIGRTLWKHKGKIATGFAGAAIATGIYLHRYNANKAYAEKEAKIRAAMDLADHRVDARNSLRAIGLDPRRKPSPTPNVREHTDINPAVNKQRGASYTANRRADARRAMKNEDGRAPLQLGSGETAKPKRSRKKK